MRPSLQALATLCAMVIVLGGCGNKPSGSPSPPTAASSPVASPLSIVENELMQASEKGDTARVQSLLDQGLNVNLKDPDGRTPLTEAVYWGHADTVKLLLSKGADVNAKKNDGASPLTLTRDNKEIMDLLQNKETKPTSSPGAKGSPASPSPSQSPSPTASPKSKKGQ